MSLINMMACVLGVFVCYLIVSAIRHSLSFRTYTFYVKLVCKVCEWTKIYTCMATICIIFHDLTLNDNQQSIFLSCPLQWRHNGCDGVSNHQPHQCLFSRLFGRRSKKTSKLHVTGLCAVNSLGNRWIPAQMTSNAENVFIWWHHHVITHIAQTLRLTSIRHRSDTCVSDLCLMDVDP